jgi:YjbE family integral membrane protein
MLQTSIGEFMHAPFWGAVLQIVFINVVLSGDDALAVAMACRALPPRQRIWGLVIGEILAVALLIVFAAMIARLLQWPYLRIIGGVALLYIAVKLLASEAGGKNDNGAPAQLWRAVRIVVAADLVMSFDNMLAVVQVAKGDFVLIAIGLIVSVPIIICGAALVTALLRRLPILVWAGAALLGFVAGQTIVNDRAIVGSVGQFAGEKLADVAAGFAGALLVVAIGGVRRHLRIAKTSNRKARSDTFGRGGAT